MDRLIQDVIHDVLCISLQVKNVGLPTTPTMVEMWTKQTVEKINLSNLSEKSAIAGMVIELSEMALNYLASGIPNEEERGKLGAVSNALIDHIRFSAPTKSTE